MLMDPYETESGYWVPNGQWDASSSWFSSGYSQIPATSMSAGASSATDWSSVIAKGLSRAFDIAGQVAVANNVPYYQTQEGQAAATASANQKTMLLIFAGAALLMMIKRG